jgi:redox-sensitive bicupin YhaK (pirin superfamily)
MYNRTMIAVRKSETRGQADRGWLTSQLTFSFADYQDPAQTGFRVLHVMNEDTIGAGKGFGPHAHRDMEIITYIISGTLRHRDSMSGAHTMGPNEIQTMSAGNGVVHSEYNASETEPVHLLQIWIKPSAEDLPPAYQQVAIPAERKRGRLHLLAAPPAAAAEQPATVINQDARLFVSELGAGESVSRTLGNDRHAWVQVVRGDITVNGQPMSTGDGAAISDERELSIAGAGGGGEILLFDLP